MGMRDVLQDAVGAAFDADLSDAVKSFILKKETSATYNTLTSENVILYSNINSRGVFDNYTEREISLDGIQPDDFKLIVLQNELSVRPEIGDLVFESNNEYKIMKVRRDPADVAWELQCRM